LAANIRLNETSLITSNPDMRFAQNRTVFSAHTLTNSCKIRATFRAQNSSFLSACTFCAPPNV